VITDAQREAYGALLEQQAMEWQPPLFALSLSYHVPVSAVRIRRDLSSLHAHIDRQLLGRRFHRRQPHERSQFWAVIESMTSSVNGVIGPTHQHVHAGWKIPTPYGIDDLRKVMDKFMDGSYKHGGLWLRFADHGTYNVQEFRFQSESEIGWGFYSTKFLTDPDNILYSADFLRR
jgi:hypothetical protein